MGNQASNKNQPTMTFSKQANQHNSQSIKFIDLWLLVADELSHARLHLNPQAATLETFIRTRSDVRSYLHRAIKTSYKASQCQHLQSPVSLEAVLDILGETAFNLQNDKSGDLFDVELLEEIAWLICDRFTSQVREIVRQSSARHPANQKNGAQIVSFPDYKIRKANARL